MAEKIVSQKPLEQIVGNRRVGAYMQRMREGGAYENAKAYDLNETGMWKLVQGFQGTGGLGDCPPRKEGPIYKGRFVDVLAEAVGHPGYGAAWCSAESPVHHNGYLLKVNPVQVTETRYEVAQ